MSLILVGGDVFHPRGWWYGNRNMVVGTAEALTTSALLLVANVRSFVELDISKVPDCDINESAIAIAPGAYTAVAQARGLGKPAKEKRITKKQLQAEAAAFEATEEIPLEDI